MKGKSRKRWGWIKQPAVVGGLLLPLCPGQLHSSLSQSEQLPGTAERKAVDEKGSTGLRTSLWLPEAHGSEVR